MALEIHRVILPRAWNPQVAGSSATDLMNLRQLTSLHLYF